MRKNHYIVMVDGSSYLPMYQQMLWDISKRNDVSILVDSPDHKRSIDILLKSKVQIISRGHLDFLAYEKGILYECLERMCPVNDNVYVLFLNSALWYHPYLAGTLQRYKKRWPNIKYILYYLDVVGAGVSRVADYLQSKNIFDLVYSYDAVDAERYQFIPWNTIYSKTADASSISPETQLYFCCGVTKARIPILEECLSQCQHNQIDCRMDLVCNEPAEQLRKYASMANLLKSGEVLPYPKVLQRQLQAHCMLEIVQPGRTNLTLRPYEAVAYNRKLLTNSKSILSFKYYNPEFMQYFENIEDIDWQWVKHPVAVDYNYKEDFSPSLLLNDLSQRL